MSVITHEREQVVSNAIREISHIATLPEVTVKVVELVESPKSTAQDLHKVISTDPALCSRILKVVNSSFYGLPGQVGSINRAIVMLGLNAVKNIAIAASMAKLFRGGDIGPSFSGRELWAHCNITAATAKMIAGSLKLGLQDEAFLGGLIHDIGLMVEMQYDRTKLQEVLRQTACDGKGVPGADMILAERTVFGADHQDFGAGLCERWKFPKSFAFVTGFHHRPLEAAADSRTLPALVYVADRLAADSGLGFRGDLVSTHIEADVLDFLKLSSDKVNELREQVKAHASEFAAALG
ncbi:MAG TPA: HDOD domain-containing protein [Phycisphaerales bacterium]|nr:HDOD domain-containing protein [Phycisphaerales bacterium]